MVNCMNGYLAGHRNSVPVAVQGKLVGLERISVVREGDIPRSFRYAPLSSVTLRETIKTVYTICFILLFFAVTQFVSTLRTYFSPLRCSFRRYAVTFRRYAVRFDVTQLLFAVTPFVSTLRSYFWPLPSSFQGSRSLFQPCSSLSNRMRERF